MSHARLVFLGISILALSRAGVARADGAFPDSLNILLPPDRPSEMTLATNFGLISSEDGGASWTWACETPLVDMGVLYQLGPGVTPRMFSVSLSGLVFSDDAACGWTAASGDALAGKSLMDAFPDPHDAAHVLAIALTRNEGAGRFVALESRDGGATFAHTIYSSPADVTLTGIEVSRSDPRVIYLAGLTLPALTPRVTRSGDGGATWTVQDLGAKLGTIERVRLVAVDPVDPNKVFLRVALPGMGEALAVVGGPDAAPTLPVSIPGGVLTSFVRMNSGTIMAAGIGEGATGMAFRSRDGGASFVQMPGPRRFRALAERQGKLFAAADNWRDDFALGVSDDEGTTWRGLMRYGDVRAVKPCVDETCRALCRQEAALNVWPASVCSDAAPGGGGRPDGGATPRVDDAGPPGGGCATSPGGPSAAGTLAAVIFFLKLSGGPARRRGRAPRETPGT